MNKQAEGYIIGFEECMNLILDDTEDNHSMYYAMLCCAMLCYIWLRQSLPTAPAGLEITM